MDYDPAARTYSLREDYRPFVTGPTADNLARQFRYITLMGQVVPKIVERFRTGGGLAYADYPDFHAVMAEDSASVNDAALVDAILPLTGLVERLRAGLDVADVGCGQGHAINLMARAFPASRFTGIDFSDESLTAARAEAAAWGLTNATFTTQDAATITDVAAYDLVTAFDAIHDQAHPGTVLANIRRALRPGGTFLMVDINASSRLEDNVDLPWASFLYAASLTHCMTVSLGQGGEGLGTVWGVQTAERMLREAGFTSVVRHELPGRPVQRLLRGDLTALTALITSHFPTSRYELKKSQDSTGSSKCGGSAVEQRAGARGPRWCRRRRPGGGGRWPTGPPARPGWRERR